MSTNLTLIGFFTPHAITLQDYFRLATRQEERLDPAQDDRGPDVLCVHSCVE